MGKFPQQVDLIERVKATLNLTDVQLATEIGVRPETMQKYAAGYQKAGTRLLQLIENLPDARARKKEAAKGPTGVAKAEPPSTLSQLDRILKTGTIDEVRLVRQLIEALSRQIGLREKPDVAPMFMVFEGKHRFLPALGYIPAGVPQEAIQQSNQFIAVPEGKFAEADYALKVQGDSMVDADVHHGDWVAMTIRKEPRNGSIVAALVDGEATLKTYVHEGRQPAYLRSENKQYPAKIVPKEELKVQGVVLGKLPSGRKSVSGKAAAA